MSKISRFCDSIIESAWLLALIITPIFFMVEANHNFELPKIYIFRSIIWFAVTAWVIKALFMGYFQPNKYSLNKKQFFQSIKLSVIFENPVLFFTIGLFFVYLVSSSLSISPRTSFLGIEPRLNGFITIITYLMFFAILVGNIKKQEQFDRIVTIITLDCFLIDGYALLQYLHLDPFSWPIVEGSSRIISTIGQPIFTAAFLAMASFLILPNGINSANKFFLSFQSSSHPNKTDYALSKKEKSGKTKSLIDFLLYIFIFIFNLVSIWFTVSRGPILGLICGLVCFFILYLYIFRSKKLLVSTIISILIILSFLAILNIPTGPLQSLRDKSVVGPLGHLLDTQTGTGQTRVLIWQGMAKLTALHPPLEYPDHTVDNLNPIRWLTGYGSDTLALAFEGYYNQQMYLLESPFAIYDRAHNRFWDVYYFYGISGILAEYGLTISLIMLCLQKLELIINNKDKYWFWFLSVFGGLSGILIPFIISKPEFIGISSHLGVMLGLIVIIIQNILFRFNFSKTEDCNQKLIIIGLLASLVTHHIELSTGILTITSSILFWGISALVLVFDKIIPEEMHLSNNTSTLYDRTGYGIIVILLCVIIFTFGSNFIVNFQAQVETFSIMRDSLLSISIPVYHYSPGIFLLLIGTLVFGALLLQNQKQVSWQQFFNYFISAITIVFVFSFFLLLIRAAQLIEPDQVINGETAVLGKISNWNWLTTSIFLSIFFFLILLALILFYHSSSNSQNSDKYIFLKKQNKNPLQLIVMFCLCEFR